jgi:hypothetical protein
MLSLDSSHVPRLSRKELVAVDMMRVVLSGGPDHLPDSLRLREVSDLTERVKVPYASGYEHFVRTSEVRHIGGALLPVFQWCYRTHIAE